MNLLVTLRIALRALAKNKMRAGLTVLGVVIGIAAVTAMVSVGQSAGALVRKQFEMFGTNVIVVLPGSRRHGGVRQSGHPTLTAQDANSIGAQCPAVLAVSPMVFTSGQVIYGNVNWSPNKMRGVGEDYLIVRNWSLRRGGFFTQRDIGSAAKTCVIGQTLVAKLFQTSNPIGQTIRVKNIPFRVIGVLQAKGANMVGEDQGNVLLMPYSTVRKRLQGSNFNNVHVIMVSARSVDRMAEAAHEISQLLYERHRIPPGENADFEVRNTTEIANMLGMVTGTMTLLLAAIAGISLLVGGVGVMNIMLVSVLERTREIGIRKAVGARRSDIMVQFLIEAVTLSLFGGLAGILAGWGFGILGAKAIPGFPAAHVPLWAVLLGFGFAALTGIVFGVYPAAKASSLDPIEALRYE